jgi:hypothetical protein
MNLRKPLLAALALAWLTLPAIGQTHRDKSNTIIPGQAPIYLYDSAGASQFISSGTLASATSLIVPTGATIAQICVETAGVRYHRNFRVSHHGSELLLC